MNEEELKDFAAQLRKPVGEFGLVVGEKMNKGNVHMNRFTIEALAVAPGDTILEIGMGNGFFVKDILDVHPSVTYAGCDYSELMVQESIKLNSGFINEGRAQFFTTAANKLPFKSETFNKVFTVNTLYFWDDYDAVFNEIKRVLKPTGELIISIRPKSLMQYYPFVQYGFTMFSAEEAKDLLLKNGFAVTSTIEREEPEQILNGEDIKLATLIITSRKR